MAEDLLEGISYGAVSDLDFLDWNCISLGEDKCKDVREVNCGCGVVEKLHTRIEYGAGGRLECLDIAPVAIDGDVYGENRGGAQIRVLTLWLLINFRVFSQRLHMILLCP